MKQIDRRRFIKCVAAGAAAGAAGCATSESPKFRSATLGTSLPGDAPDPGNRFLYGACRKIEDTPMMKDLGYDFFENSAGAMLVPDKSNDEWRSQRRRILNAALPLRSCNGFLPAKFRLTGPKADFAPALDYADILCRRADEVGLKYIVFGSGGARNVPSVFGPDQKEPNNVEAGRDQFIEFNKRLADRIANRKVTIVIEPLCPNESNIINYVWQGLQIVEDVKSPRLQQLADIFHMICGRESACSLIKAGDRLKHCHIAAKVTRQFPGSNDTDFSSYFNALNKIGYTGGVSCECSWGDKQDLEKNLTIALTTLKKFAGQA